MALRDDDIGMCDHCGSDDGRRYPTVIVGRIQGELRDITAWLCLSCRRGRAA